MHQPALTCHAASHMVHPAEACLLATLLHGGHQHHACLQGRAAIDMEVRDGVQQPFGRGHKVKATFAAVIDAASRGDSGCYLSTQRRERGADGFPAVMAEPLTSLAADFPLRPALLGNLVPEAVNLWMGHAPDGASSGWHLYLCPGARRNRCGTASFQTVTSTLMLPQACTMTSMTIFIFCCGAGSGSGCFHRNWRVECTRTVACSKCTPMVGSLTTDRCGIAHQKH